MTQNIRIWRDDTFYIIYFVHIISCTTKINKDTLEETFVTSKGNEKHIAKICSMLSNQPYKT